MTESAARLERKQMLLSMNVLGHKIKNQGVLTDWFHNGIGENVFPLNFDVEQIPDDNEMLSDDKFRQLMDAFLDSMIAARDDDGLEYPVRDRKKALLAMEFIARQINDEEVFYNWLMCGVPDGDIKYGCFDEDQIYDDDSMMEDYGFYDIVECFLRRMTAAHKSGGLWCGDICTEAG